MRYKMPYLSFMKDWEHNDSYEEAVDIIDYNITVEFTDEAYDAICDTARRPVYAVRGKPVQKEVAHEIIRKTDDYLHKIPYNRREPDNIIGELFVKAGLFPTDHCLGSMFCNHWFPSPYSLACGWCHPDGYIGTTDFSGVKNPFPNEMLDIWYFLITKVSKDLDIIAVVLDANERLDVSRTFEDQISFGVLVNGCQITLLEKEEATCKFKEYDQMYGDHELVRPVRDPAILGLEEYSPGEYNLNVLSRAGWEHCCVGINHFLDLRDDSGISLICAVNGRVDKNNPMYYGVPDFTYQYGPMKTKDLEAFIEKWKAEEKGKRDLSNCSEASFA